MSDKKPHGKAGRGNKSNLRPPWKPGESGNPSGRPKRRPITEGYIKMARQKIRPEVCKQLGMKSGSTYADALAHGQFIKAIKGDVRNASEIRDAIEGSATQRVKQENMDKPLTLEEILEGSYSDDNGGSPSSAGDGDGSDSDE